MPWSRSIFNTRQTTRSSRVAPEVFAEPDSQFIDVNGLRVHYKTAGQGAPALVLLHGSFLSVYSWREVMAPLSTIGTVSAFDRPAFGLTARPMPGRTGANPYSPEGQADLTAALLERWGMDRAVLVGSSTGGTTAILTALRHPDRVRALVLVDAMAYSGYAVSEFPGWLRTRLRALGPLGPLQVRLMVSRLHDTIIRSFWYDKTRVTPELLARYRQTLQIAYWDRALWELTLASHALGLDTQIGSIRAPALVITGDQDRTVRPAESHRLANELPNAELVVIPDCGHLPQEEQPEALVQAVRSFFSKVI